MKKTSVALFAAAMAAASSASAADLGRPAPAAVDYVKVCDAYGEGFFYIPGTQTCLKVGGFVRAEYRVYDFDKRFADIYGVSLGTDRRDDHRISTRARAAVTFDARSNTEFGLLRSFIELWYTVDSAGNGKVDTTLQKAYIQWGGLTAGRAQSFFDFYLGDHYSSFFETAHSDSIVNLLAYTFSFGNGISATLSVEDPSTGIASRRYQSFAGWAADEGAPDYVVRAYSYGGVKAPDIVGNVNISQAWGSAQVMAVAHQDYSAYRGDRWGYAVGAGVTVKLPMIAEGDAASLQVAYADGALSYVTPDPLFAQDFVSYRGIRSAKGWSIAGGFTHNWTGSLTSSATVSYADIDHPGGNLYDFEQFDAGVNLVWAAAPGLTIGGELEYKSVDLAGGRGFRSRDVDALVGLLRVQRDF